MLVLESLVFTLRAVGVNGFHVYKYLLAGLHRCSCFFWSFFMGRVFLFLSVVFSWSMGRPGFLQWYIGAYKHKSRN